MGCVESHRAEHPLEKWHIQDCEVRRYAHADGHEHCLVGEPSNAEDGLKLAASESPDLIIMDMMMPGIDGIQATRLLKKDEKTKNIPVKGIEHRARDITIR